MSSHPRLRHRLAACVLACSAWLAVAVPATAQDTDDDVFDENETEGTVDSVRYQLWAVAGVTGALLVVYIWHTDPARRQRVADRRQADRDYADALALEDQFLLPADFDGDLEPLPGEVSNAAAEATLEPDAD